MTTPRSNPWRPISSGAPGVGSTPPSSASPPAAATPAATAASSISPDSRVSRMTRTRARSCVAARARPSARSAVRNSPATPRTPSVPNSLRAMGAGLALAELRALARLLQAGLLTLLRARVTREEAAALELAAQVGVGLHQRAGHAVAQGAGLGRHSAAVDAGDHVHLLLVARRLERSADGLLQRGAREEVLERAAVDLVHARARLEDHAGDGGLALAGGLVARVGGQFHRGAGRRRGRHLGGLGRGPLGRRRLLAVVGVGAGGVVELALRRRLLLLGKDRLEVLARDHVALGLLDVARTALRRLAARTARVLGGLLELLAEVLAVLLLDLERVRVERLGGFLAQ